MLVKLCEYRQKSGLRLAGSGAGGEQQVVVAVKDHLAGRHLVAVKLLPFILINKVLDKRRQPVKYIHPLCPRS